MSHDETVGELLERALRQLVREELEAVVEVLVAARLDEQLGVPAKKAAKAGPPRLAPPSEWEPVEEFQITSGSRHYAVKVGNPVKVKGEGRSGAVGDGWTVIAIQQHKTNQLINVEVRKDRTGHSRTFKSDKIVYKRPPKGRT